MKRIEAEWQSYKAMVLPVDAGDIQIRETKKAFYAGAAALFDLQMRLYSRTTDPNVVTESDLDMLTDISSEINAFKDNVTRGVS